jgi:Aldehyde dehydrogenase family/GMC oxidoreductase
MTHAAKDTAPRDLRHSGDLPTNTSAEGRSIIDPATGAVIDTVPEQGRDAVDAAVGKARAAFEHGEWPAQVRSERARSLLRIADAGDPMQIQPNMLSHPDDLKAAIAAVELCREIGNSAALRPFAKREAMPGNVKGAELERFIRDAASTYGTKLYRQDGPRRHVGG